MSARKPAGRIPHPCLADPKYDSVKAVNWMLKKLGCKTDSDLCRKLDVDRPCISKIRHRRQAVGDSMLIKLHKITNMQIRFIEAELGMK